MKRVFVTGASGFLGAALVQRLVQNGVQTAVLLRPHSRPWRLSNCIHRVNVIEGALQECAGYSDAIARFAPDTVFHLAWQGVHGNHRDNPEQIRVNIAGTTDVFLASVQAGVRAFIASGSQAEYGPSAIRIDESHQTKPTTLYGAAKLATLGLLEHLAALYAVRLAWLRVFSLYGPRDDEGTMITSVTRCLLAGERPAVTEGKQLWDYLHVDDAVDAFLAVAQAQVAGVFNVGHGLATPLQDTLCIIRDLVAPGLEIGFGDISVGSGAVTRLEPDVTRIQRMTGWAPRVSLEDGLRDTVSWHLAHRNTGADKDVVVHH